MKKQSDLSRLMGYAGNYRYFTYASWVLSAASALVALVPFVYIWKILRDVLNAAPNYAQAVNIPYYGWMAVLFAVLFYLVYIAALMCSHLSAARPLFPGWQHGSEITRRAASPWAAWRFPKSTRKSS